MSTRSRAYPWFSDEPHRARPLVPDPVETIGFTISPIQPPDAPWLMGFPVVYGDLVDKRTGRPPLEGIALKRG